MQIVCRKYLIPEMKKTLDKQNIEANLIFYSLSEWDQLYESGWRPLNLTRLSLCVVCNTHGRLHSYLLYAGALQKFFFFALCSPQMISVLARVLGEISSEKYPKIEYFFIFSLVFYSKELCRFFCSIFSGEFPKKMNNTSHAVYFAMYLVNVFSEDKCIWLFFSAAYY